tara:strand:- start:1116 stop:1997 length:882 start_codon:yes stop_codon:yes gene_type:complete
MRFVDQVKFGYIRCPSTKALLKFSKDNKSLINNDVKYFFNSYGAPVLLENEKQSYEYLKKSKSMINEYEKISNNVNNYWKDFKAFLSNDYRSKSSKKALKKMISNYSVKDLCLNLGGGPSRMNEWITNVNIAQYLNIDVVADAHNIPYADNCVDFIHCEAVFEHLYNPQVAAHEMYRILKDGGKAYVVTPFMQTYHGYPDHYQNFTISGHKRLFQDAGFKILESGSCVGPLYSLMNMITAFIKNFFPSPLNHILRILWAGIEILLRPIDLYLANAKNAYVMSSSTYVVLEKNE